jgi:hypothetical protein
MKWADASKQDQGCAKLAVDPVGKSLTTVGRRKPYIWERRYTYDNDTA